tara:strand:- start:414 stop:821 length:408 start_codon:yes stop_codon:yes gene_type:complete
MSNLLNLTGSIILDPSKIEQGINYFLDYLAKNNYSEKFIFSGGNINNEKTIENVISNPYFLSFSKTYKINPEKQAVFQDHLGQIFIGDKEFPKRNKTLILEIQESSKNLEEKLIPIIVNTESLKALEIIQKNKRK